MFVNVFLRLDSTGRATVVLFALLFPLTVGKKFSKLVVLGKVIAMHLNNGCSERRRF